MALLKFLRRPGASADPAPGAGPSAAAEAVQAARQQARRRLIGAVVLLGIGIIGFPLVFQTQPRPIPVDIPIDIPNRDKVAPLGTTPAAQAPAATVAKVPPAAAVAPVEVEVLPGARQPGTKADLVPDEKPVDKPDGSSDRKPDIKPEVPKPEATKSKPGASSEPTKADAAKTTSDKTGTDKDRGRFVVQAGSYTDLDAVREVRSKLERMGLKTYTQAAVVDGVTRVRVRVGPYGSREEAQAVQNKIKAAGVAASLLQL